MRLFANKITSVDAEALSCVMSITMNEDGKLYHLHHSFYGDANAIFWCERYGMFMLYCPEDTTRVLAFELDGQIYLSIEFNNPDGTEDCVDVPVHIPS